MKLEKWVLAYSDAEVIYNYFISQLGERADRNVHDAVRKVVAAYCRQRPVDRPATDVSMEWVCVTVVPQQRLFWMKTRLAAKYMRVLRAVHPFYHPPAAPTYIQISWNAGAHRRVMLDCNLQIRQSARNSVKSPETRRTLHENA